MAENRDDKLAEITDKLLAGESVQVPLDLESEVQVIRRLNKVIGGTTPLNIHFRERMTRRLDKEWDQVFSKRRRTTALPPRIWMAAAAMWVIILAAVLIPNPVVSPGTADGSGNSSVEAVLVMGTVILAASLFFFWWRRRF